MHALIAEDDRLVARDYTQLLRTCGVATVAVAASAQAAMVAAEQQRPDVALIDITLRGDVNGLTLGELLTDRGTAVIYVGGRIDAAVLNARDHALDILAKPLKETELAAALAMAETRRPQDGV